MPKHVQKHTEIIVGFPSSRLLHTSRAKHLQPRASTSYEAVVQTSILNWLCWQLPVWSKRHRPINTTNWEHTLAHTRSSKTWWS